MSRASLDTTRSAATAASASTTRTIGSRQAALLKAEEDKAVAAAAAKVRRLLQVVVCLQLAPAWPVHTLYCSVAVNSCLAPKALPLTPRALVVFCSSR